MINQKSLAKANADKSLPRSCPECKEVYGIPEHFGEQRCKQCGQWLVVCSDGVCWRLSGMGHQNAAGHEHMLHKPPYKAPWTQRYGITVTIPGPVSINLGFTRIGWHGPRQLKVYPTLIVVTQSDLFEDGSKVTWYPLHIKLQDKRITVKRRKFNQNQEKIRPGMTPLKSIIIKYPKKK